MFSRSLAFRMCLRSAVFVGAAVCMFATNRAHAQSGDLISPLSNVTGPADSTPSADYVRNGTEPPRFDPNSPEAKAARAKAASAAAETGARDRGLARDVPARESKARHR